MEPPTTGQEAIGHDESPVHNWRVSQLKRLGVPGPLAEIYADRIDWHQMARLVRCGCPPRLALRMQLGAWLVPVVEPVLQARARHSRRV